MELSGDEHFSAGCELEPIILGLCDPDRVCDGGCIDAQSNGGGLIFHLPRPPLCVPSLSVICKHLCVCIFVLRLCNFWV
jgi:hypothetical protein